MAQIIRGVVGEIGKPIAMKRGDKTMKKVALTIQTPDGQKLFVDLINRKIKFLKEESITKFSMVEIDYSFKGTTSGDKRYNNIFVNSIKKLG